MADKVTLKLTVKVKASSVVVKQLSQALPAPAIARDGLKWIALI